MTTSNSFFKINSRILAIITGLFAGCLILAAALSVQSEDTALLQPTSRAIRTLFMHFFGAQPDEQSKKIDGVIELIQEPATGGLVLHNWQAEWLTENHLKIKRSQREQVRIYDVSTQRYLQPLPGLELNWVCRATGNGELIGVATNEKGRIGLLSFKIESSRLKVEKEYWPTDNRGPSLGRMLHSICHDYSNVWEKLVSNFEYESPFIPKTWLAERAGIIKSGDYVEKYTAAGTCLLNSQGMIVAGDRRSLVAKGGTLIASLTSRREAYYSYMEGITQSSCPHTSTYDSGYEEWIGLWPFCKANIAGKITCLEVPRSWWITNGKALVTKAYPVKNGFVADGTARWDSLPLGTYAAPPNKLAQYLSRVFGGIPVDERVGETSGLYWFSSARQYQLLAKGALERIAISPDGCNVAAQITDKNAIGVTRLILTTVCFTNNEPDS